jgi:hemerythrin
MPEKRKSRILIVDDSEFNIDLLLEALEQDYDIAVAMDGMEALDSVENEMPDLILLDIMMPNMNGYEVCRRLKQNSLTRSVPIIFLTAMDNTEDEEKGLSLGAADYIAKPINPAIVRIRVDIHLQLYHQNRILDEKVRERTTELEESKKDLQIAMKNLQTTRVTNGVYWVQVPEAGLFILCGCPEEIVKHLMIKGHIETICQSGVSYETGPNAILLSDILIQNGCFSNLAEFPLLQMLYRQGLIIPGHPNNKGNKPILIGSKEQIESQKEYIFRGNYGLTTEQELLDTGVSQRFVDEMMRLKKKFRFGQPPNIDELIDTVVVENKPIDIKNGVEIKRIDLNHYEFSYKGLTTRVDLNLAPRETYPSPYSLGSQKIKREYFSIIHSGEGDGWNITQPSMNSIIVFQGGIYLIDLPPNILSILRSLGIDISEVVGIFHTHAHDDHFASMPILLKSDHRIKYYATPLVRASVSKKFAALLSMDETALSCFFEFHDLEFDCWNDLGGLEVKPIFSPHPVETNIFIFRALGGNGYKTYAHYADIISLDLLNGMVGDTEEDIDIKTFTSVKDAYLEPADLKKLDVGGGMIHGLASDFTEDTSKKIILAHLSAPLPNAEKEIGSEAGFGMVDVLIPARHDLTINVTRRYLSSFFSGIDNHAINTLLNADLIEFNPGSLIFKKGEFPSHLFMVLTGTVECLDSVSNIHTTLSTGSFVGEFSINKPTESKSTYRAVSHVSALKFSFSFFHSFLKTHDLLESTINLFNHIDYLRSTRLFDESCSYGVLNRIARFMDPIVFDKNMVVTDQPDTLGSSNLFLIKKGAVRLCDREGATCEKLKPGDFFNEHRLFNYEESHFTAFTSTPSTIYELKDPNLLNIPIVHWKLMETNNRRKKQLDIRLSK